MADDERFAPTSGRLSGIVGLAIAVAVVATALLAQDAGGIAPWGVALALFAGAVSWTALLKPGLALRDGALVMRNMFSTVWIPLHDIESVVVRQVTAVMVGERRYVSAAVGRSRGQLKRDNPPPGRAGRGGRGGSRIGGLGFGVLGLSAHDDGAGHESNRAGKSMSYGHYVEGKIRRAADEAQRVEPDPDAPEATRVRADWLEIVAVAGTAVATVVLLVV